MKSKGPVFPPVNIRLINFLFIEQNKTYYSIKPISWKIIECRSSFSIKITLNISE